MRTTGPLGGRASYRGSLVLPSATEPLEEDGPHSAAAAKTWCARISLNTQNQDMPRSKPEPGRCSDVNDPENDGATSGDVGSC